MQKWGSASTKPWPYNPYKPDIIKNTKFENYIFEFWRLASFCPLANIVILVWHAHETCCYFVDLNLMIEPNSILAARTALAMWLWSCPSSSIPTVGSLWVGSPIDWEEISRSHHFEHYLKMVFSCFSIRRDIILHAITINEQQVCVRIVVCLLDVSPASTDSSRPQASIWK